jgi:hypothetical protein
MIQRFDAYAEAVDAYCSLVKNNRAKVIVLREIASIYDKNEMVSLLVSKTLDFMADWVESIQGPLTQLSELFLHVEATVSQLGQQKPAQK